MFEQPQAVSTDACEAMRQQESRWFRQAVDRQLAGSAFSLVNRSRKGLIDVIVPFYFSDGDCLNVLVESGQATIHSDTDLRMVRITDAALNMMHWSIPRSAAEPIDMEPEIRRLCIPFGARYNDGTISMAAPLNELVPCLMRYCVMIELISAQAGWATWPPYQPMWKTTF